MASGQTITITTYATATLPDTTYVKSMIYHVEKDGKEIAKSEEIAATEIEGSNGKYQTEWKYTIPTGETSVGSYHIWVQIKCAYKTTGLLYEERVVLGSQATNTGLFGSVLGFFRSLFGLSSNPVPTATPAFSPDGNIEIFAPTGASLKLGTFRPVINLRIGCKEIWFDII
jgi:hypothetical protein